MTSSLGQAKLILDLDAQPLIAAQAEVYADVRREASKVTKELAKELEVRRSDVKAAASIIIDENKKAAAEEVRIAKQVAAEKEKTLQDALKAAKVILNNEQLDMKATIKQYEAAEKEKTRAAQDSAKERQQASQALINANKKLFDDDVRNYSAALRRNKQEAQAYYADLKKQSSEYYAEQVRQQAQQKFVPSGGGGILGTGIGPDVSNARLGATAATLLGFGAIASGAVIVREAMVGLTEVTLKQEQAQRSLQAAFGATAEQMKRVADTQADVNNKSQNAVEQGTAYFGILQKQYGATQDQTDQLIAGTIKLQKAFGGDLVEAFREVSNAIQGEPQALEKYGIALQQNAIIMDQRLTPAEQRNYQTMTARQQAAIRLRILLDEMNKTSLTAASSTDSLSNAFDKFNASSEKLGKVLSKEGGFGGALIWATNRVSDFLGFLTNASEETRRINQAMAELEKETGKPVTTDPHLGMRAEILQRAEEIKAREVAPKQQTPGEVAAALTQQLQNEEDKRTDDANQAAKKRTEILIEEVQRAGEAELRGIEDRKKVAEREQKFALESLEIRHKAEIAAINETEYARETASKAELARIEQQKANAIKAAEDRKTAELQAIDATEQAVRDASAEQIRQLEIQKEHANRANEARHKAEQDALELQHRNVELARKREDDATDDATKKSQRKLEDAHKKNMRRLEDEATAERDKSQKAIRALEDKDHKEDENHTKTIKRIEDENKAALDAAEKESKEKLRNIEAESKAITDALDAQIKGIDDAQKAQENLNRTTDLQRKVSEASINLSRARPSGTPEQIAAARERLTGAVRIGDPEAIKKAEQDLVDIAGKGDQAIQEAEQKLADAQKDLRDEGVKETQDAEKEKLQAAKDAEKDKLDAAKQTEQDRLDNLKDSLAKQLDAEKSAADKKNQSRNDNLTKDKQAEQDRLKDALDKIEKRKRAEEDAYDNDKRNLDDTVRHAKDATDTRRAIEDNAYKDAKEASDNRYNAEKDQIHDTYDGEEHGYIPAVRRAEAATLERLKNERTEVETRYKGERDQIAETYDNKETGLIAQHQRAEDAAKHEHSVALAAATAHYEEERRQIEHTYRNAEGTGILDNLDKLAENTRVALQDTIGKFKDYQHDLVGDNGVLTLTWAEATRQAKEFFDYLQSRGGLKINPRIIPPQQAGTSDVPHDTPGPSNSGGTGESTPPPVSAAPSGPSAPPPTHIPPQIDQFDLKGLNQLEILAACGPAAIGWFASMIGQNYGGKELIAIAKANGGWNTDSGMLSGTRGFVQAVGSLGIPTSVIGNPTDDQIDQLARRNVPFVMNMGGGPHGNDGHFFQVYGGSIRGLNVGGSGVALKGGGATMSMGDIRALGYYPQALIIPDESVVHYRDSGYLFKNPTLTMDTRTGELNKIAEIGPERLLGRVQTAAFDSRPNVGLDYVGVGTALSSMGTTQVTHEGDRFIYNGVAPEDIFARFHADQRRNELLRGLR